MRKSFVYVLLVFMVAMFYVGCQQSKMPLQSETVEPIADVGGLIEQINIPAGATLDSAIFSIYSTATDYDATVEVFVITTDWTELGVTWNWADINTSMAWTTPGGDYGAYVGEFDIALDYVGWNNVDITSAVMGWISGADNFGILLKQSEGNTYYNSSELPEVGLRPKLTVYYTVDGTQYSFIIQRGTFGDVFDSYITPLAADDNEGYVDFLVTRLIGTTEKRTVIKFDMPTPPPSGCTLTPGYWKTHSEFGPAPYDDTWAQLSNGASTPFFSSGQTYYEVFWTSPSGNAYYILAHAYMAAELNVLNGTSIPPDVQAAWDAATDLFNQYTPAQVAPWKGNDGDRKSFVMFASILDDYNNGVTGPGHCGGY